MDEFALPLSVPKKPKSFYALATTVRHDYGIPVHRQIGDIIAYGLLRRQFGIMGYYDILPPEFRIKSASVREYVNGYGAWLKINRALRAAANPLTLQLLDDKLMFSLVAEALSLPVAPCLAFFHATRAETGVSVLRTPAEIAAFLRRPAVYPLFGKPTNLESGLGAASVTAYDPRDDALELLDGQRVAVDRFAAVVARDFPGGYLFQPRIVQHPAIAALCGDTVSTVRVVTVREAGGAPRACYASWKLALPGAMSDNSWRPGSISAAVDLRTGRVIRAQSGLGVSGVLVSRHPGTGAELIGMTLPHWGAVVATTCRAHAALCDALMIGWDVAITPDGPVLIEGNTKPNHLAYQVSTGRGALGADFAAVARRVAREHALVRFGRRGEAIRRKAAKISKRFAYAWRAFGPPAFFSRPRPP